MARFLFAVFPATGHINPGLPIARELVRLGHDVRWYSTPRFSRAIEATGARFVPWRRPVPFDEAHLAELFPDRPRAGLKQLQWDVENIFVAPLPAQFADLEEELRREPADVVVGDNASIVCHLLSAKLEVPFVIYGAVVMSSSSRDTAPFGLGLLPSSSPLGRLRNRLLYALNERVIFRRAEARYNQTRVALGLAPYGRSAFDFTKDADLYLQGTVPSFEYPRSDMPENVRWIGATIPAPPENWTPPSWWHELDGRPSVLVTQGTINNDYDQLIRPAIRALGGMDLLVVVTTGTKEAESVGIDPLPPNVRVERFVPYAHLMPKVSALVTNGGYGSVQIALAHGVPIVAFGKTEEKPEVANRVTFSGAGIGMKILAPTERQIRESVTRLLEEPSYRLRAKAIAEELSRVDGARTAAQLIAELVEDEEDRATA